MKLGFITPTYPGEKRVALLPEHITGDFENELIIEDGYGSSLAIGNEAYERKGCKIDSRANIFATCDTIFCLKLIQPEDYEHLREGQMIIGWTHPTGSGTDFYRTVAYGKKMKIVDLDNIYPTANIGDIHIPIPFIKKNFVWKNSFYAGVASVQHALLHFGMYPDSSTRIAVLACGSCSQGAYSCISKYNADVRLFYRKTMNEFYETIGEYDIVINGIEVDGTVPHIITKDDLKRMKKGCLIIDAAADAGNAIEGTRYMSIANPMYEEDGLFFYEVNNAPSLLYRKTSHVISESFSEWVYKKDVKRFWDLFENAL
jgi:N5-(carboxyethyl)ornithine synthase